MQIFLSFFYFFWQFLHFLSLFRQFFYKKVLFPSLIGLTARMGDEARQNEKKVTQTVDKLNGYAGHPCFDHSALGATANGTADMASADGFVAGRQDEGLLTWNERLQLVYPVL